jgi:type IX secretion system PorP/SprF family membrane protein
MKLFFKITLLLFCAITAYSQELPINSQIYFNPYTYNPAFAGFEDRPAVHIGRRQQWTGIEGAPVTTYLTFTTLFGKNVQFGVNINSDKRSILSTTNSMVTLGYRARFDEFHYLSFALSGGLGFNDIDLSQVDLNDPVFRDAYENSIYLNGNAGLLYYLKGFRLGVSLPNIFTSKSIDTTAFNTGDISPLTSVIGMMSYRWEMVENSFALEPYGLYYHNLDLPGQFEAGLVAHIQEVVWIGGSYRQDYGTTAFVGFNIGDNLKFGYGYEFSTVQAGSFSNGSHDLQMGIIFGKKKKQKGKVSLIERRRAMLRSMGRLPSQQEKQPAAQQKPAQRSSLYTPKNDPFETKAAPQQQSETTGYSEEDALKDLLSDMEETPVKDTTAAVVARQATPKPTQQKPVATPRPTPKPEPKPAPQPEPTPQVLPDPVVVAEPVVEPEPEPEPVVEAVEPEPAPVQEEEIPVIAFEETVPEPQINAEEEELIRQLEQEALEEFTFDETDELTTEEEEIDLDALAAEMLREVEEGPEEFLEPTLNDAGVYIGPTTVQKGSHLLELEKGHYVVVGTYGGYRAAEEYSDQLFIKGFYTKFGYVSQTKIYYVYIFYSDSEEEVKDTAERFKELGADFKENWILTVQ